MPAVSGRQFRLMEAAAHGDVGGINPNVGKEFVQATNAPGSLPESKHSKSGRPKGAHHRQRKHQVGKPVMQRATPGGRRFGDQGNSPNPDYEG